jgi:hypothetical protein
MGRKKKPEWELPEEVRIVLQCSPNLMPCKRFRHANIYRFADHMKNDKCQQCIAFFRQADKELKTMKRLSDLRSATLSEQMTAVRELLSQPLRPL